MKLLIAGSRSITNYNQFHSALISILTAKDKRLEEIIPLISEVVSGCAIGVDKLGEVFAKENNIPIKQFFPDWDLHGKSAGFIRNKAMIDYLDIKTDVVILIWDGSSKGTASTKKLAIDKGLTLREKVINPIIEKKPRIIFHVPKELLK